MSIKRDFAVLTRGSKDRTVEFVFSTATRDRHGTVIDPQGWDLRNFKKNPVASYRHEVHTSPDPDVVIGRADAWIEGEALVGTITFETKDVNPLADKVYKKVLAGTLSAVSVGFAEIAGHWGDEDPKTYYFDKVELLEISIVAIPSNPDALKRAYSGAIRTYAAKNAEQFIDEVNDKNIDYHTKLIKMKKRINVSMGDKKTLEKYSITKAIGEYTSELKGDGKLTGIELEMHQEARNECSSMLPNKLPLTGLGVPSIIHSRADLQATTDAVGGYAVGEEVADLAQSLRANTVVGKAGATVMAGLHGDVRLPFVSTGPTAAWRAEGGVATQSDPVFSRDTMTPHRLTFYTTINNQLLNQTSAAIDREIYRALYYPIEIGLEDAVFNGSGTSNVPAGLFSRAINDGDHGSNGTILSYANILQLPEMVAADNALKGSPGYVTNSTAAFAMAKAEAASGSDFIWQQDPVIGGTVAGYPAYMTNVIESDRTRGTNNDCSAIVFGNWQDLVIGQWGPIDIRPNPYVYDTYGQTRIVVAGYFDLAVKHLESFAAIKGLEN